MEQERNVAATKLAAKHYFKQVKQDWYLFLPAVLVMTLAGTLIQYVPTLIVAQVLVKFSEKSYDNIDVFIPYILLLALVWAVGELLARIGSYFEIKAQVKGLENLYNNGMKYLLSKDISFFHDNFTGSLTKRLSSYAWKYMNLNSALITQVLVPYLPIIFVVIILWQFSPWLVVALLGLMLVTGYLLFPFIKKRQKLTSLRESANAKASGNVADIFGNIDAVKSFANDDLEYKTHAKNIKDLALKGKASWDYQNFKTQMIASPMFVITNIVGLVLAIMIGGQNGTTMATIFITFNFFGRVTDLMWNFNGVYRDIESSLTEAAQFTDLLLEEPKVQDISQPKPFGVTEGKINLMNVSFRYDDGNDSNLFKDLNLTIKPGEKVALVGHSGGGKTTITKLLMRYMDINDGEILIDEQNIALVKQGDLRKAIAYVPQEPVMFHRSLMDNIRYGKLDASDDEVKRAAKLAHAHEFIKELPQGYATLVGERGIKLSGGQRQRIAIARAMIKDAPILLLDEATSALDSESEKYIQDALWKLMEGRTTIVIAHRLSTIQKMDRIIVLENGQVAQQGTHKELLASGGIYANLWAHQSGGFIEE